MFEEANDKLSKRISRTVWKTIHHVLKYKAPFMALLLKKWTLTSHLSFAQMWWVSRKVG